MTHSEKGGDCIVALATARGTAAIAVLRLSGYGVLKILRNLIDANFSPVPRRATLATLKGKKGETLDDALCLYFPAPHSYTGEEMAEISCHGGVFLVEKVYERLLELGARTAEAGEFTLRAFLNGKLDLSQAEAVNDIITARGDLALRSARALHEGKLSKLVKSAGDDLLKVLAQIEANIDFPEEDIDPAGRKYLAIELLRIVKFLRELAATSERGRILREGALLVIGGEANVGKSSLMNLLLGRNRAIVSKFAGTTRDFLQEKILVGGIPVQLTDTAGLRRGRGEIEAEGVTRARKILRDADLILHVFDLNKPKPKNLLPLTQNDTPEIIILNKSDLKTHPSWTEYLQTKPAAKFQLISCREESGVIELEEKIRGKLNFIDSGIKDIGINRRAAACVNFCLENLTEALRALNAAENDEIVALSLRQAFEELSEINGKLDAEEVLGEIFGNFCIGK